MFLVAVITLRQLRSEATETNYHSHDMKGIVLQFCGSEAQVGPAGQNQGFSWATFLCRSSSIEFISFPSPGSRVVHMTGHQALSPYFQSQTETLALSSLSHGAIYLFCPLVPSFTLTTFVVIPDSHRETRLASWSQGQLASKLNSA